MTDYLAELEAYVRYCFEARTALRVDELASRLHMHPSALSRGFKSRTGQRLARTLKDLQLSEAKRLLATTSLPTRDVASRAGFGTPNTLFRLFRTRLGVTPESYRRRVVKRGSPS
ncbi:MAG TPA: helix-turn-helix transcriptional regulator [Thermoanaerobaculia bacterium]|nr:helix-turn-helix transcriptional regulator [Thermoanaerobaculia bacterium]